jgi:hypothetical protein
MGICSDMTAAPQAPSLPLRAEAKPDRVVVWIHDKLFTAYLFEPGSKLPCFYPVNGPRSGKSVTTRNEPQFPHHSSLWFGCDRVNGGNYWQEGPERGRIVSKAVRVVRGAGDEVVIEQECDWERPNAPSPFRDQRRMALRAPTSDRRVIDFDITLTAKGPVKIEKTNHSLFSGRVAPELSVKEGGELQNAAGEKNEAGTFGRPSPWADYRGTREGVTEGMAIFSHPANAWHPPRWFTRDYGFFSPTPMWWLENGVLELKQGESLRLRYRVIVHADAPAREALQGEFEQWSRE